MKSIILTALLALVSMTSWAQKQVVWENPSAFMGTFNGEFKITKAELKSDETVLHIIANYQPHNWIRFDKNSYLQTPDGKRYGITSGAPDWLFRFQASRRVSRACSRPLLRWSLRHL